MYVTGYAGHKQSASDKQSRLSQPPAFPELVPTSKHFETPEYTVHSALHLP